MSDYKEVVDIKHEILKHTLDLYNSSIPRSVVQTFVDKVAKIIAETYVPFLKQEVRKKLKHYPKLILDEISMVFEKNKYPFEAVATEHLRFELYRKKPYTQIQSNMLLVKSKCEKSASLELFDSLFL